MKKNIIFIISDLFCTFLKIGNIKYMPGTLGSLVGIIIGVSIKNFLSIQIYIIFVLIIFALAILAINIYQSIKGKKDSSEIIIDEIIGQQIPIILFEMNLLNIFLSFILFRFFDILKFFPASYIDRKYHNSFGVIGDDIIAGFQSSLVMYGIIVVL
ncbi:MAG: Phosphatidylglycerophosphatase A [Alphaproteobacteria bacterium MarineAlpha9_Bin4]|nr:phosphatidylglycerophosphatase [Pelagibacterales bacterium]PPR27605.1 MAG: Phosphatidylglycerophosphatase A [Alphaproteobacteria bacterium MarineAlpha9_Bin4]|tara:strand:- start:89 stop:556 length:468 start_codon:yes stop_codon:yes gene_type:complete